MEPLQFTSLPSMFFANCDRSDFDGWFLREKNEWKHFSRGILKTDTQALALALHELEVQPENGVGIIAPSSPNWIIADIATQLNHAYVVPLFPNISSQNFEFQCNDAKVEYLVIDKIEDLDSSLRQFLPNFKKIICISPDSSLPENGIYWNELLKRGYDLLEDPENSEWVDIQLFTINSDDVFSIIYTSGSTGKPKGVELTHRNMLVQIQNLLPIFHLNRKQDASLSFLPVAHVFERMAVYYYMLNGIKIFFADNPKNISTLMTEIRPSIMIVVPRILERLYEKMTDSVNGKRGLKNWIIRDAIKFAKIKDPSKPKTFIFRLFDRFIYKKMREAVGGNFRTIVSGSSSLNKSILRFLLNIGLPIYEGYGMTECTPVVSTNCKHSLKPGSIGKTLTHLDVKIGENNEILVKGDSVFTRYHNMPEATAQAFTEDGFYHTGDQGYFDEDKYLYFTGRIKELLKTSTGKYVSPNPIELEISRHPLVEQALVIANDRKFASAVIWLNPEEARRMLKISKEESFAPALQSPRIKEAINMHIGRINKKLNHWEQIRRWTLIGDELSVESGLLTPTFKIRRKKAEERYAEQIEKMYE